MGALSIEKVDHLLWLGRYMERSYTTQRFIVDAHDRTLDSVEDGWKAQLEELGFNAAVETPREFIRVCLFDRTNPASVAHSMDAAYDNAVRLRDVLGTETLSYIQMASDSLLMAEKSDAPLLDLQLVQDNIMAFKGCVDDFVDNDAARNIIKCGISLERIDLYARLGVGLGRLRQEVHRLAARINRTGAPYSQAELKALVEIVYSPTFPDNVTYEELGSLLGHVARLF
jgi:uncharacterized alpha-E superfamily protein